MSIYRQNIAWIVEIYPDKIKKVVKSRIASVHFQMYIPFGIGPEN